MYVFAHCVLCVLTVRPNDRDALNSFNNEVFLLCDTCFVGFQDFQLNSNFISDSKSSKEKNN